MLLLHKRDINRPLVFNIKYLLWEGQGKSSLWNIKQQLRRRYESFLYFHNEKNTLKYFEKLQYKYKPHKKCEKIL
jgi:hypothetical protein